ncbi:MAG: glycosyltransferase family 2 protein [Gemmatimonadaceae bacterium]
MLAQTHTNWEMVIVDDGSTDDTAAVVSSFTDSRISYVYQKNRGVGDLAGTLNVGLARTNGPLVTMLASDDTWPKYRLEKQLPLFDDPRVILVFGQGLIIDENDIVVGDVPGPPDSESRDNCPPGVALHRMFVTNYIPQYTVLIRRSALDNIGGYLQPKGLYAEDYPTHMTLALHGEFRYQDIALGNYRMHQNQMTRNHFNEMIKTDIPYVLSFFRSLDREMQQRTGWTDATLQRALHDRLNRSYFEIGRRYLLSEEWQKAREQFRQAFVNGGVEAKARAVAGSLCSYLHMDVEWLARLAGRPPLR